MIGIGTIGRAAKSGGGSTSNQNGQYIAISFYGYILYSSDFGQTFVKKVNPAGLTYSYLENLCISSTGEVLARTTSSNYYENIYYLSDINSNWTTISKPSNDRIGSIGASCDFSVIVYMPYYDGNYSEYYYSSNKGVSFTRYTYPASGIDSYYGVYFESCKVSADGKKAVIALRDDYFSSTVRTYLLDFSTNTTTTIYPIRLDGSYSVQGTLFIDFLGSSYGFKYMDYNNNNFFIIRSNSYNNNSGLYKVTSADSEDGVNIYYYNNSEFDMYKTPDTILFNTGNISNQHIFTVTNGSNQVFYTVNGPDFKAYNSTGDLLYTTVYPDNDIYGGVSAAISRVIPQ